MRKLFLVTFLSTGVGCCFVAAQAQSVNGGASGGVGVSNRFLSSTAQFRGRSGANGAVDGSSRGSVGRGASTGSGLSSVPNPSYPTAPVARVGRGGPVAATGPEQPVQGIANGQDLGDYEPTGLRIGTMRLYPSITFYGEATDNLDNGRRKIEGQSGETELEMRLESDWSRHRLELNGRGNITGYRKPKRKPDTELNLNGSLRLDLSDETQLTLDSRFAKKREAANNPDLRSRGGNASIQTSVNGGVQLDHDFGTMRARLRGALASEAYDEDRGRDYKLYSASGRIGYEVTDQVIPFVEGAFSRKKYENNNDRQEGDSLRGSIGIEVANREKVSGEISVGYMVWRPDLRGMQDDGIFFADASLTWSPNPLWTVRGGIETNITSTSTSANSVSTHTASLDIDYALRRNFTLRAAGDVTFENYNGLRREDWVGNGSLTAEYDVNRNLQFIARVGHERRESNLANESMSANSIRFGIKLRK